MKTRIILIILLIILFFTSIFIGAYDIDFSKIFHGDFSEMFIITKIRLPRVLSVILVGASLALAGIIMQSVTGNKFVSPTTAGTMDFARLGILVALIVGAGTSYIGKILISFTISLLGSLLFVFFIFKLKVKDRSLVPLIGILLGSVVSSFVSFIALNFDLSQAITGYLQGSFSNILEGNYELIYIVIVCMILAFIFAQKFSIAQLGKDVSTNLGVNSNIVVVIGLILVSVISSVVVVTVGQIAFIGLIIPNLVSIFRGDNLKKTLIDVMLFGAVFLLGCDILSRLIIYPYEISVGIIVSILGGIIFLLILFFRRKQLV